MIVGRPLIRVTGTGSTMDLARRLSALGASAGTAVLAGHQTAGRGRAGRTWATAPGSAILMSFVAQTRRQHQDLGALSLLLGLAVAETVDGFTGQEASIKWPNDVLVEGRKIAGLLVTSQALPDRDGLCLIVGIGLNVAGAAAQLPGTATSLAMCSASSPALDDVLPVLLGHLTGVMERFEQADTSGLWRRVEARLAFREELVRVADGPRTHEGILRGVSSAGLLELELLSGDLVGVASGDLTRGPVGVP